MRKTANAITHGIERSGAVLATGCDFVARSIYLYGDICDDMAYRATVGIRIMDEEDGNITLFLNSCGGHVESGMAIFDAITMARNQVDIVVSGAAMSMAAILLQAGDLRLMTPYARFMIHTGSLHASGEMDSDKLISIGREIDFIRSHFVGILAARSTLSPERIMEMLKSETYFSAQQCLEAGFIDGIVTPEAKVVEVEGVGKVKKQAAKKQAAKKQKDKSDAK